MVLEAKFSNQGVDNPGKRQLVCVVRSLIFSFIFFFTTEMFSLFHSEIKDVSSHSPMAYAGNSNLSMISSDFCSSFLDVDIFRLYNSGCLFDGFSYC